MHVDPRMGDGDNTIDMVNNGAVIDGVNSRLLPDERADVSGHARWDGLAWAWAYHKALREPRFPVPAVYNWQLDPDEQGWEYVWQTLLFYPPWRTKRVKRVRYDAYHYPL